jgi:hypothetical protein
MENTVKVRFTKEVYNRLSHLIFEKITDFGKNIAHYQLILTVPVASEDGGETVTTTTALQELSTYSFAMSRMSTILHSLEVANAGFNDMPAAKADRSFIIDVQSVIMLREFVNELLMEQTQIINDYSFKLNTFVSLGRTVDNVTSLEAIDTLRASSVLVTEFSDMLSRFEIALKEYATEIAKPAKNLN